MLVKGEVVIYIWIAASVGFWLGEWEGNQKREQERVTRERDESAAIEYCTTSEHPATIAQYEKCKREWLETEYAIDERMQQDRNSVDDAR